MKDYNAIDFVVNPLRRRLNLALWMNTVLGPFIILAGVFSTALLVLKMIRPDYAVYSLFLTGFAPFVGFHAWLRCRKRRLFFNKYEALEIVDCLFHNDGSVTAFYEKPSLNTDTNFYSKLHNTLKGGLPTLAPVYYLKRTIPVLLYCTIAFCIPPRIPETLEQHRQIVTSLTQPLFNKIEENSALFSDEEKAELLQNLDEIENDNSGISREKWEAIEEVQQRIDKTVDKKNQKIQKMMSDLNRMSTLLDNQEQQISPAPGSAQTQARMDKLMANLSLNLATNPISSRKQADIERLLNEMKKAPDKEALGKAIGELQKQLSSCCSGTESWYQKGEGCEGEGGSGEDGEGNVPGRGGVTRGRADAPMVFGDDKSLPDAKFKEQELANRFLTPEDLADLGITPLEPNPDPEKFSPGALKQFDSLEGTQVSRTRISPGQKDVISKYFAK